MNSELQVGNYGLVKIIAGQFAGRFGYYDDDGFDEDIDYDNVDEGFISDKAIVYFGNIINNSEYVYLDYDLLTQDYTFSDLTQRSGEIELKFWDKITYQERCNLMEEKQLIDMEIRNITEDYILGQTLNNKKVFLSHSSLDKSIVISIAMDLNKRGISTWLDTFDILPGESIVSKINEGIKNCDYLLLFLSTNSVNSKWVQKEWETLLWDEINDDKIKIIPIKLDDVEIPKILQTKKYIDLSKNYNAGLFEIISTIKRFEKKRE